MFAQPLRFLHRVRPCVRRLASLPEHREIIMPKVSPTMTVGRLITWKKREGDAFAEGEDIADVESDKATMPISAREDGYMARIFVQPDTPDIPLGQILAITVEEQHDVPAFKDYVPHTTHQPPDHTPPPSHPSESATDPSVPPSPSRQYTGPLGPAIMRLLNQYPDLNLNAIAPTGPNARLLKGDVLAAIEDGTAFASVPPSQSQQEPRTDAEPSETPPEPLQPVDEQDAPENFTDTPVDSMRRAIAKRLLKSKTTVPHRYASASYRLDDLLALRKRLNAVHPSPRISVNDFIIRAVGIALRRVPAMNVFWNDKTGDARPNDSVDISMAVAIPGGLITPIVTDVDRRGLAEVADVTKALVAKARQGTLAPEEFEGGCFSVTNLGMFGISSFSAIINPPQSGILAVGGGIPRAVMNEDGTLSTVTEGVATLSTDARAVDEETAATFLSEVTNCLANPENMLA